MLNLSIINDKLYKLILKFDLINAPNINLTLRSCNPSILYDGRAGVGYRHHFVGRRPSLSFRGQANQ